MSEADLQIVVDESGEFDRFELDDEVLVSNLCANETIDVQAELRSRGFVCTTRDLAEFVMPIGTADGWKTQAKANVDEWGLQDADMLLLAIQEELGELTQAYLEARCEDGDPGRIEGELTDLGALCFQLSWALEEKGAPGVADD